MKKIDIFNDVNKTREALSSIGIGEMRRWWTDSYGYMSASNYYELGELTDRIPNNVALYLTGENIGAVQTAKLVLNINDNRIENDAIITFFRLAKKFLEVLNLETPKDFTIAASIPKERIFESDTCTIKIFLEQSRIESWHIIVNSH